MPQMTDTINAKLREPHRKGAAHKLRKAGLVPAIAYGPKTEPRYITIDPKTFVLQRAQFGTSHIFDVAIEGSGSFKALIREVQQNPMTDEIHHIDLYALDMSKPIRIEVPVELEGKPAGLLDGGILQHILRRVMVEVLPTAIPKNLTADVSSLNIGQSAHLSDLKLPEGVKLVAKADEAIAACIKIEEEAAPTPAAEGAVPAEGEAAAAAPAEGEAAAAPAEGAADAKAAPAAKEGKEGKGKK